MNDLSTPHPAPLYRYRWLASALIAAGAVLWVVTGDWQWILLPFSILYLVTFTYMAVLPREMVAALAPGRPVPGFTRGERLTEAAGVVAFLAGINAWAWTGRWGLALIGVAVWAVFAVSIRVRASRRPARPYVEATGLAKEAERLMEQGRFGEGAAAYDRLVTDTIGASPQGDDLVLMALYSKALDFDRQGRREEAVAGYLEVATRCAVISTTTTADILLQTRRRLRELGH